MSNKKISEFTALTTPDNTDVMPIVDTSATETKKITYANLLAAIIAALPSADETTEGIAEIATDAEMIAHSDGTKIVTPLKVYDWLFYLFTNESISFGQDVNVEGSNLNVDLDIYIRTSGGNYFKLTGSPTGARTLTLPDATDTLVGKATSDTLTNKVLSDSTVKFGNVSDITKALLFSLGGATTGKTLTIVSSHTNNRTATFPDRTGNITICSPTSDANISGMSTITFTGSSAPTTLTGRYSWDYISNSIIQCNVRLEYSSAGSGITAVEFTLPSDMPTPAFFTGWGNSEFGPPANAELYTAVNTTPVATRGYTAKNSGGTLVIGATCSSNAIIAASFSFQYFI